MDRQKWPGPDMQESHTLLERPLRRKPMGNPVNSEHPWHSTWTTLSVFGGVFAVDTEMPMWALSVQPLLGSSTPHCILWGKTITVGTWIQRVSMSKCTLFQGRNIFLFWSVKCKWKMNPKIVYYYVLINHCKDFQCFIKGF